MIEDIRAAQKLLEKKGIDLQKHLIEYYITVTSMIENGDFDIDNETIRMNEYRARKRIEEELHMHANFVVESMWELFDRLMLKYADGGITLSNPNGSANSTDAGYPKSWLEKTEFSQGPERRGPPAPPDNRNNQTKQT